MRLSRTITVFIIISIGSLSAQTEQEKLDRFLEESFSLQSVEPIESYLANKSNQSADENEAYWTSLAHFYKSVYYSYSIEKSDDLAELSAKSAIELLKKIEKKSSEEYALLSYVHGWWLQWQTKPVQWIQAPKTKRWSELALELNQENPRALFVRGNLDSYTPTSLGGGKKAADLLKRALVIFKNENSI